MSAIDTLLDDIDELTEWPLELPLEEQEDSDFPEPVELLAA